MIVEMKMPNPGESITEVEIAQWLVADGDYVERDQLICEIDSDKAMLELNAEESGAIKIIAKEGETIAIGDMVCTIDTKVKGKSRSEPNEVKEKVIEEFKVDVEKERSRVVVEKTTLKSSYATGHPSPAAKKIMNENDISPADVNGTGIGGRITKTDVLKALAFGLQHSTTDGWGGERNVERKKMSSLRKKLSQRLVVVKNQTAMLTTFNEVDMSAIVEMRKKYKEKFEKKHGVKLGFMSFFTKAITEALEHFPTVNAMIDGDEIVYHKFADVGIAVSSPKGLVVPVLRNAESMTFAQIESAIKELAAKAREGKITIEEMTGGTFTITNGGVFGSMMSTPILNPPQSAILGMHNIIERPIAVNGKVEVHPMMYVALSYDHRIIDGKESVSFLVEVKEMLEDPTKMMLGDTNPVKVLLGL